MPTEPPTFHSRPLRLRRAVTLAVALTLVPPPATTFASAGPHLATAGSDTGRAGQDLRRGSRGAAVAALQRNLISLGVPVAGGADGIFGPATERAVRQVQSWNGLPVTGAVTAATAAVIARALPDGRAPGPLPATEPAFGVRSDATRSLQARLTILGFPPDGGVDGLYGPATAAAVAAFQFAAGLAPTGRADRATLAVLTSPPTTLLRVRGPLPRRGQRSDAVRRLQQALAHRGHRPVGGADGRFGPATAAALARWQRFAGLSATGVLDAATAARLASPLTDRVTAPPAPVPATTTSTTTSTTTTTTTVPKTTTTTTTSTTTTTVPKTTTTTTTVVPQPTTTAPGTTVPAPDTPSPFAPHPRPGERSDRVAALQRDLAELGFPARGGTDGFYGPETVAAVAALQRDSWLPATGEMDDATAAAMTSRRTATRFSVFPVHGTCWYRDSWMAPRSGGRRHEGADIIATRGTPVLAVFDGTITRIAADRPGSLGGNSFRLSAADGTYAFYGHLDQFAPGMTVGLTVTAGDVLGTVGSTGNATVPHLHIEWHPGGGRAYNPTPMLRTFPDACRS